MASGNFLNMDTSLASSMAEEMCRKMGVYPNCQCPGFNGRKADDDAGVSRSCYDSWCQDPKAPCMGGADSGDHFVTCVKTRTAGTKLLQWDSMLERLDMTA